MSTAVIAPVNPMSAEGKDTVLQVMRRDRENFTRMVSEPKNWYVETRCVGWETRDLVGHTIDVMEGYFKNWDAARAGKDGTALGLPVMGETLNDHALEFRQLSREEALDRFKKDAMKLDKMLEELTPEEWTSFMVYHPVRRSGGGRVLRHVPDHGLRRPPIRHRVRSGQQARDRGRGERGLDPPVRVHLLDVHGRRQGRQGPGLQLRDPGRWAVGRQVARHCQR